MHELLTAEQMRKVDRLAIEQVGLPAAVLMENAGTKVADVVKSLFAKSRVVVLAGNGNNGGDGCVVARRLRGYGFDVRLVVLGSPQHMSTDARLFFDVAALSGVPCYLFTQNADLTPLFNASDSPDIAALLGGSDLIIDAILGTGLRSAASGVAARAIELANDSGRPIVAVDLPSGIDCDNGTVPGVAIKAHETVTLCRAKTGLVQFPAAAFCGRVWLADIGIDRSIVRKIGPKARIIDKEAALRGLVKKPAWAHKGDMGETLVFAGSKTYPGAVRMCAAGATAMGSGLLRAVVPGSIWLPTATSLCEAITVGIGESEYDCFDESALAHIGDLLARADAVLVGPGISVSAATGRFLSALFRSVTRPLLVDADALTLLAEDAAVFGAFKDRSGFDTNVLTPHPGEAARLLKADVADIQNDRCSAARQISKRYHATVVLKGARTVVAADDFCWINLTGNAGLASGGTGDVLAGVIASLMAQGASAQDAACAGVMVHGLAADILGRHKSERGITALDVARKLPEAVRELEESPDQFLEYIPKA